MEKINITVKADNAEISTAASSYDLQGVDVKELVESVGKDKIVEALDVKTIVKLKGTDALLEEIGVDAARKHFDLGENQ